MRGVVLVFATLLVARVASAQSPPPEAIREGTAGQAAYDAGDFATALTHFERARSLYPDPILTYNVARCHDRLGHPREAVEAYRAYLSQAGDLSDADRREVDDAIRRNEALAAPEPTPGAGTAAPATSPPAETGESGLGWPFYTAAGVAAVGAIGAVVFNFVALSEQRSVGCGTFDDWAACDTANTYTTATLVLGGVALAAAGVATVLWLMDE